MKKTLFLIFVYLLIFSCSSKKDILFIQDIDENNEYSLEYADIRIKPDDILRIRVSSNSPELSQIFSFDPIQSQTTMDSYRINGYLVNSDGFIKIPSLKPVYVNDLTITQASNLIEKLLSDEEILSNSTVDIKIVNSYFTVLGEVNMPGRYSFLENNMNLFQALGIAGDLTINGKRDDIKILSLKEGAMKINSIDITSSEFLKSKKFQIFPGDIIIVNANNARVKNAGIVGNFGNLLSVLSFILSTIIVISNN